MILTDGGGCNDDSDSGGGGGCDDDSDRCILATGSILLFPLPRSIIDPGRF